MVHILSLQHRPAPQIRCHLAARQSLQVPSGFEPDDDPAQKIARAKSIIEAAMGAAGGDAFHEL